MKKWFAALIMAIGFSSGASAIGFSVGGGLGYSFSTAGGSAFQGSAQFTVRDLVSLGPVGVDARISLDLLIASSASFGVKVAPFATFNLDPIRIYAGPSLGLFFGGAGTSTTVGVIGGLEYPIALGLYAFAEASFDFIPVSFFTLRAGVNFHF